VSRLLVLLPSVPAPLDSGARIRNAGLLQLLGCDHEVDAIAFGSPAEETSLAALARRTVVVEPPCERTAPRRAVDLARTDLPDMASRLWSPGFWRTVRGFTRDGGYDAVQAEGIEMARYLAAVPPERRVYDAHNAEFLLQRRLAESGSGPVKRLYSRLQWRRLERFEREVVLTSRLTLAVSSHDANQLQALAGAAANVRVVPNGIDAARYTFRAASAFVQPNLLFLGKLDFRPNAQALAWFIDHVLPKMPLARLFAVGDSPPPWLIAAGQHDDRIAVTGYVADERVYMERCAAMVLPLRTGGGSRLKALIAMASGLPIVATGVGMEGLDAEPGTHYLRADTAAEWIDALGRVLVDAPLRERLARNARMLVEERYDWPRLRADVRVAYTWLEQ
jgi:polysaccharide biosynthesis protein PslH